MNVKKIMKILKELNIDLSENAVVTMLKDGTLTDNAPIEHYIVAKNINEALNDMKNFKIILKQNLPSKWSDKLIKIFKEEF